MPQSLLRVKPHFYRWDLGICGICAFFCFVREGRGLGPVEEFSFHRGESLGIRHQKPTRSPLQPVNNSKPKGPQRRRSVETSGGPCAVSKTGLANDGRSGRWTKLVCPRHARLELDSSLSHGVLRRSSQGEIGLTWNDREPQEKQMHAHCNPLRDVQQRSRCMWRHIKRRMDNATLCSPVRV
ncbi:hypothetical protein B0I37DRAFT_152548 [Chaetomium sp. MPI-CAGE-AT-0009]|nr:hypothetical protein B0I37DRAFT_152548 [Chaetomium sp. MPI-CAGE-AT-0009]